MDYWYAFSGLAIGAIVGMTGVGGGALMTPLLVIAFGIPPAIAVGTDLLYGALTKAGGAWIHRNAVDWKIVGLLASGSIPAAIFGILLLESLPSGATTPVISTALGIALVLTSAALLFRERIMQSTPSSEAHAAATVISGAIIGFFVSVSSIGAGALGTVALFHLYPRLSAIRVVATDIAHAVPLTAIAGTAHAAIGTVDFHLLEMLILGSLPGIHIGSLLASKIPEKMLRRMLAGMLILIGGKLIF